MFILEFLFYQDLYEYVCILYIYLAYVNIR